SCFGPRPRSGRDDGDGFRQDRVFLAPAAGRTRSRESHLACLPSPTEPGDTALVGPARPACPAVGPFGARTRASSHRPLPANRPGRRPTPPAAAHNRLTPGP